MFRSWSIGFPVNLSGLSNCPFSFLGCSLRFSQSALLSVFSGRGGFFLQYLQVVSSPVFEQDGLIAAVAVVVLILFVG